MALASRLLAVSQPDHARATTPRGTCTAAEGLDAETFRGFQLAGELFLLTSFFIEPEGSQGDPDVDSNSLSDQHSPKPGHPAPFQLPPSSTMSR